MSTTDPCMRHRIHSKSNRFHRIRQRRIAVLVMALLIPLGLLTACGSGGGSSTDIVVGQVTEPEKIPDPILDGSLAGYNYYYNVFDQLTALDTEGKIVPRLATSWKASPDFRTWTYTLRTDAKFTNGDPVTAQDVAFTYNTILAHQDSDNFSYMEQLQSVQAVDAHTVTFSLNAPFSPWPSITTAISIVPEKVYKQLGSEGFAKAPVGSGPFKFVSWQRGVDYVIERNDAYWGPKPKLTKVTFQTVADENARLNGVQSGSLDLALISPNQVDALNGNSSVTVASRESNGSTFLGMNSKAGVLTDPRIRLAIAKAIDINALAKNVLAGRGTANSQLVAPNVTGFVAGMPNVAFDPAGAKALLGQAGYSGQPIPFQYATDGRIPLSSDVAQAIEGFLTQVGIKVDMMGTDQASLSDIIYSTVSAKGLYLNTWAPSTMDGDMPVTNLFGGGQNDYAQSPETNALVLAQRQVTGAPRVDVFRKLFALNEQQAYIIGLYTPKTDYAVNPNLVWQPRADGEFYFGDTSVK